MEQDKNFTAQSATTPVRGITAKQLFAKSDNRIIQDIVQEQVKLIDGRLLVAQGAGFSSIEYELPTNFSINNMDKKDAQIMIYSEILLMYKNPEPSGKGFEEVHIMSSGIKKILKIDWVNGMDDEERKRREKIIQGCVFRAKK